MKKQILAISVLVTLSGCNLDNKDALEVPATFANDFTTEVGFYGTEDSGFDVTLTTGHGNATGILIVNDVNYGEAEPNYDEPPIGNYGTFTLEYLQSGYATWTYDLDETHPEVAAILDNPNGSLTDVLTVTTLDGTTQAINFNIQGVDPSSPAEIKGALLANASIRETSAYGSVTVYDPNFDESKFQVGPVDDDGKPLGILSDKQYGSLFIEEDGRWEFKVNKKADGLADLLPEPDDMVSDTVTITSADGTTQVMNISIYGAVPNFAAGVLSSATDDSRFDINTDILGFNERKTSEGKMVFKIKITDDLAKEAAFSMACETNFHKSEDRRVATFYVKPDGQLEMWSGEMVPGGDYFNDAITGKHFARKPNSTAAVVKRAVFDQRLVPGEWSEFVMEWHGASRTSKPKFKAWLDGEQLTSIHGAIPTDPNDYIVAQTLGGYTVVQCVNMMRFEVKPNEDVGGFGAFLVDDIQFYTDRTADPIFDADTKAHLNEKFANSEVGAVVKEILVDGKAPYITPGKDITTTDNVLIVKDL